MATQRRHPLRLVRPAHRRGERVVRADAGGVLGGWLRARLGAAGVSAELMAGSEEANALDLAVLWRARRARWVGVVEERLAERLVVNPGTPTAVLDAIVATDPLSPATAALAYRPAVPTRTIERLVVALLGLIARAGPADQRVVAAWIVAEAAIKQHGVGRALQRQMARQLGDAPHLARALRRGPVLDVRAAVWLLEARGWPALNDVWAERPLPAGALWIAWRRIERDRGWLPAGMADRTEARLRVVEGLVQWILGGEWRREAGAVLAAWLRADPERAVVALATLPAERRPVLDRDLQLRLLGSAERQVRLAAMRLGSDDRRGAEGRG